MPEQTEKKKTWTVPTVTVYGRLEDLTQGNKLIGVSDGWFFQGQGLQTVS